LEDPDILTRYREQPIVSILARSEQPEFQPLNVSPWLAMSLLQKSIRRGHVALARRAAATLLRDSPERLWRRCGGIAFEDIGVADLNVVSLVCG
jgi:replication-associated recombination protein RarA